MRSLYSQQLTAIKVNAFLPHFVIFYLFCTELNYLKFSNSRNLLIADAAIDNTNRHTIAIQRQYNLMSAVQSTQSLTFRLSLFCISRWRSLPRIYCLFLAPHYSQYTTAPLECLPWQKSCLLSSGTISGVTSARDRSLPSKTHNTWFGVIVLGIIYLTTHNVFKQNPPLQHSKAALRVS